MLGQKTRLLRPSGGLLSRLSYLFKARKDMRDAIRIKQSAEFRLYVNRNRTHSTCPLNFDYLEVAVFPKPFVKDIQHTEYIKISGTYLATSCGQSEKVRG